MFEKYLSGDIIRVSLKDAEHYRPFPKASEREIWEQIDCKDAVLAAGEEAKTGYPMLKATDFMAFRRTGNRKIYEGPYFERRSKLVQAIIAECAAGDGSFLDAVIDGIWCVLEESSWIISAHNNIRNRVHPLLPDPEDPFICLFSAQTAQILAYAVYLLGDKLDAVDPVITRRVRDEMEKRIFKPFLERDDMSWMGFDGGRLSNWTPWILSNVLESFLFLCEDREKRVTAVLRAMQMLDFYIAGQPEDGGCDEGCGYWNMASGSLLDCLDILYRATDGAVDCYSDPMVHAIGTFPMNAHISGSWYWNFADCDARPGMEGERIARFGEVTGDRALMSFGEKIMRAKGSRGVTGGTQMNRLMNTLFHRYESCDGAEEPEMVYLPVTQVYARRAGSLYGVIKGGHNAENHNHNDLGSFMIYVNGSPAVVDLGNQVYTARTFSSERYTLTNTRSRNHNVPLIGGIEQRAGREYAAGMTDADENGVVVNIGGAYPEEAGVSSIRRFFSVSEGCVKIEDTVELKKEEDVSWVFMVLGEPVRGEGDTLKLSGLRLMYPAGGKCAIEPVPDDDNRMLKRFPERIYRVEITYPMQKCGTKTFLFEKTDF